MNLPHIKSGYIAILGAPNAGKSTLLNSILKEKIAIVTNKPQTTRKKMAGIYSTDTVQMIFLDTPGVHESQKSMNQFMLGQIDEAIKDADVLCYLVGLDEPDPKELVGIFIKNQKRYPKKKAVLVVNKIDLNEKNKQQTLHKIGPSFKGLRGFHVSAKTGEGIEPLLSFIESLLPEGPAYYPTDQLSDQNVRDLCAEMIREKATLLLHQELPYVLAVEIESFKEEPHRTKIVAALVVEQESQKGMVIGKGGQMIREIGTQARTDMMKFLDKKVYLELRVKVDKNWTKNPQKMAGYGYDL